MEYPHAYYAQKVCAVTGAASGIGLALCEELLECGATVTMADFHKNNLDANSERLEKQYPGKVNAVLCNVTVEDEVRRMVDAATVFGGGKLDLLINCAGAAFAGKFTKEPEGLIPGDLFRSKVCTNEEWEKAFALNFFGAVYGCAAALPGMAARGDGQIVNIISGIVFSPMAYQCMYAATKSALSMFTSSLRYEYALYGVKLNTATPGTTATAIFQGNDIPPEAQSPHASAQRILNGAAENERIILGDDSDVEGGTYAFLPDECGKMLDEVYLGFAKQRQAGTLSFVDPQSEIDDAVKEKGYKIHDLVSMQEYSEAVYTKMKHYIESRDSTGMDPSYYAGKTAAVTGGASGVGLALAEKLLECGAKKVVLADFNQENLNKHTARLSAQYPGSVKGILCNVADEENVKCMITDAHAFFDGSFDLLINCAGIGQKGLFVAPPDYEAVHEKSGMIVESHERWDTLFAVNFFGPLYGCRAVLPIMIAQKSGQIVNIISGTGVTGMPYYFIYAATKAALNLLTLTLRYEYWNTGVRFNAATPGTTSTAIFDEGYIPPGAQTPAQSALRILTGVSRDDRITFGDNGDLLTAMVCYNTKMNRQLDELFIGYAKADHDGTVHGF